MSIQVNDFGSGFDGNTDDTGAWVAAALARPYEDGSGGKMGTLRFEGRTVFDPTQVDWGHQCVVRGDGETTLLKTWTTPDRMQLIGEGFSNPTQFGKQPVWKIRCPDDGASGLVVNCGNRGTRIENVLVAAQSSTTGPTAVLNPGANTILDNFQCATKNNEVGLLVHNQLWLWILFGAFTGPGWSIQFEPLGGPGHSMGIVRMRDFVMSGNGIRFTNPDGRSPVGGNIELDNILFENSRSAFITVDIGQHDDGHYIGNLRMKECHPADYKGPTPMLHTESGLVRRLIIDRSVGGYNPGGKELFTGKSPESISIRNSHPSAIDFGPELVGPQDLDAVIHQNHTTRSLSPIHLPSKELSLMQDDPETWGGQCSIVHGQEAPDGTATAYEVAYDGPSNRDSVRYVNKTEKLKVGDYIVVGAWFRSMNPGESSNGQNGLMVIYALESYPEITIGESKYPRVQNYLDGKGNGGWLEAVSVFRVNQTDPSAPETFKASVLTQVKSGYRFLLWRPFAVRCRDVTYLEAVRISRRLIGQ